MRCLVASAFAVLGLPGAAAACPSFDLYGQYYELSGGDLWSAPYFYVTAGGENDIQRCPHIRPRTDRGPGWFTTAPDFTFNIYGMQPYALEIRVDSACDAALLINTASAGWYYDDDDNGNADPMIYLSRPLDGYLDVWVGTYDGSYCDAALTLETFSR